MAPLVGRFRAAVPRDCPILVLRDRRLLAWAAVWGLVSLVAYGLVAAIIPNPVFGRQIPPTSAAIAIWIVSAPLIGLVTATYTVPSVPLNAAPLVIVAGHAEDAVATGEVGRAGVLAAIGSVGGFLAIGCPVCNKIALVLLGASGAVTVWAPVQPVVGVVSIVLLGATLIWRLRIRARGGACST